MQTSACTVQAVLFDFGGVLAEEGFHQGLLWVAEQHGLDGTRFFDGVAREIYESGYLEGRISEGEFWNWLNSAMHIPLPGEEIKEIILRRFLLRPWMVDVVRSLNAAKVRTAILSDQTNWLEELDQQYGIYRHFEQVFNSYRMGLSKYRPQTFHHVLGVLGLQPEQALFVDDNQGHIQRAAEVGLRTIHYVNKDDFLRRLAHVCPGLDRNFPGLARD
jgi:HAD superfamily hydrolase (TIGR01509 family)